MKRPIASYHHSCLLLNVYTKYATADTQISATVNISA